MNSYEKTQAMIRRHLEKYPQLELQDLFKYIFQSSFGCEHMISSLDSISAYLIEEYKKIDHSQKAEIDPLDGDYSRVYLSIISEGLSPSTLAKIFFLSSKQETDGRHALMSKLSALQEMVANAELPFTLNEFDTLSKEWHDQGYPAIHHSQTFRNKYHPAYRVIANRYVDILPHLIEIDKAVANESIALEEIMQAIRIPKSLFAIINEIYS